MSKIKVKINGKDIQLINSCNVAQMLQEMNVTETMFVIEKNHEIVPKENYKETKIEENDVFEIIGFFGGG